MFVNLTLFLLVVGLPLAFLACMLTEWLPKHMEQQEAMCIQEILDEHGSVRESRADETDLNPLSFWHLPKLSVLNAGCVGFSLFAISVAIQHGQTGIQTSLWAIWSVALVVLAFVDARTKLLPDVLTLPLLSASIAWNLASAMRRSRPRLLRSASPREISPSSLRSWAMRLAKRRGRKKAIVALARKMGSVLHRMWIDGIDFQWEARPI